MLSSTVQSKRPNVSTPRTKHTKFLHQFIGDYYRMLYLHGHTHTLVEFARAVDEVFKQAHREFGYTNEVSYNEWVSRKDQWDKDFDIKNGGPSKEVQDELLQYPTMVECNEGKIRPRARQPGYWLPSDHGSISVMGIQPPPLAQQPNEMYLMERGPVYGQMEEPWRSGGSLSNAHRTSIVHPFAYHEPFTQIQMDPSVPLPSSGPHGDTGTPSTRYFETRENVIRPAGTNEWNVVDPTLPYGLSPSTYPSSTVQPTSSSQDLRGGRNTPVAQAQHKYNPQTRPSA